MGNHEMNSAERKALDSANRILSDMFSDFFPSGNAGIRGHRNQYIYWITDDQRMFCYTPWKDHNGNYFTWVMKPVGKGAKSGKATRWTRVGKRVRSRKRKTAKARAYKRYQNWLKYLEG